MTTVYCAYHVSLLPVNSEAYYSYNSASFPQSKLSEC